MTFGQNTKPCPAFPYSRAILDGCSSVHERRPGDDAFEPGESAVASTVYEPDGSTTVTWTDGLKIAATGYGRRTRLAVIA